VHVSDADAEPVCRFLSEMNPPEPVAAAPERVTFRPVIRYQGSATIRQGKTVIEGACVVESADDQLAELDLPWAGRFHDPAPAANLEEGRAWLRLNEEPVREGAIKITRAGSGSSAGLIDFDGIGSLGELR
jgi:hypothetical protein